jgi:hypothetical protein
VVGGVVVVGELAHAALADVGQRPGVLAGLWSASASGALRPTFVRTPHGRKTLLSCRRHDDR